MFKYMLFPKGYIPSLYRIFYYIPSFMYVLYLDDKLSYFYILNFLITFIIVEFIICPSRNIMNDVNDYHGDIERGGKWNRFVNHYNVHKVLNLLILKLIITFLMILIYDYHLLIVFFGLILTQLAYDGSKGKYPLLSALFISFGYIFRTASIFIVFDMGINLTVVIILFLSFITAIYQTIEWRTQESEYLVMNNSLLKPGSRRFYELNAPLILGILRVLQTITIQFLLLYYQEIESVFNLILLMIIAIIVSIIYSLFYKGIVTKNNVYKTSFFTLIIFTFVFESEIGYIIITLFIVPYAIVYNYYTILFNANKFFNRKG